MPFNTLLLTCLIPGTSFTEQGATVRMEPRSGETLLFFAIDDQSNPGCGLRQAINLYDGAICDLAVFYVPSDRDRNILCLVELKGSELDRAAEQIRNTYRALSSRLRPHAQQVEWKAYILEHGSAPKLKRRRARETLQQILGKKAFAIKRDRDLGAFLRV
ncbi:MAG TPA: hypothetical protein ENJ31_02700 [Anaerolineae bacterium]|nr:hypothetical protein [Anaerolineae bacterium]